MLELLALPAGTAPTALFTSQNMVTIGAITGLRRLGCQHRIALVGFDDVLLADLLEPGLTVIAQDATAIGSRRQSCSSVGWTAMMRRHSDASSRRAWWRGAPARYRRGSTSQEAPGRSGRQTPGSASDAAGRVARRRDVPPASRRARCARTPGP